MKAINISRRRFLAHSVGASAGGISMAGGSRGFPALLAAIGSLAAQSSPASPVPNDYRALVCLFMQGGNDSHNWVVPVDNSGYADYARSRSVLALPQTSLSVLSGSPGQGAGRQFAFANDLEPMRALYEQGNLAVVANVGTLQQPTSKADFNANVGLPPKLFSHNDQQSNWQALAPEGASAAGWGGRIADVLMSANGNPVFTTVSPGGGGIFLTGLNAVQYQITTAGPVGIGGLLRSNTLRSDQIKSVLTKTQAETNANIFQSDYARVVRRSADAYRVLAGAVASSPVGALQGSARTSLGQTIQMNQLPLAKQLMAVAQMISVNQTLGMRRQVFMVSMGGFDTHANEMRDQPALMTSVAASVAYFMEAMRNLGLANNVTLFTASDFGRTLTSNGSGSDHGWGSHHFVAGGAVKGKDIYGRFPSSALGGNDDVGSGRLLPSTSVTEYAATLARWMGVSNADLPTVLAGVGRFSGTNLNFL